MLIVTLTPYNGGSDNTTQKAAVFKSIAALNYAKISRVGVISALYLQQDKLEQISNPQALQSEIRKISLQSQTKNVQNEKSDLNDASVVEPTDYTYARTIDPVNWKSQDHYKIMGLSKLRYKATPENIKIGYKLKCLEHHPDKQAAKSQNANDDKFFKCIQKAYDQLSDPIRRRQYDSVDPQIPDIDVEKISEKGFFESFGSAFNLESRFSVTKNVPSIGDSNTPYEIVLEFYKFWSNFKSWRSYEYLDKGNEKAENRDEKRMQEKENKSQREKLKKQENSRRALLIEKAIKVDPRIIKHKNDQKLLKELKSKEKQQKEQAKLKKIEQEKEAETKKQEEKAKLEKKQRENERKLKAEATVKLKNLRKVLRTTAKQNGYFYPDKDQLDNQKQMQLEGEFDLLLSNLNLENTEDYHSGLLSSISDLSQPQNITARFIERVIRKNQAIASSFSIYVQGKEFCTTEKKNYKPEQKVQRETPWSAIELEGLIKAIKKYPGGTVDRWEVVGNWLAQHTGCPKRLGSELIKKSAELRKGSLTSDGTDVRQLQTHKTGGGKTTNFSDITVNYRTPDFTKPYKKQVNLEQPLGTKAKTTVQSLVAPQIRAKAEAQVAGQVTADELSLPWTKLEQSMLETGMKQYPPSYSGEKSRWDMIADVVGTKTKKEIKQRVKFLAEQARAQMAKQLGDILAQDSSNTRYKHKRE